MTAIIALFLVLGCNIFVGCALLLMWSLGGENRNEVTFGMGVGAIFGGISPLVLLCLMGLTNGG